MNRKYKLSTALDIDDLLMECTSYAIKLANEKYPEGISANNILSFKPLLSLTDALTDSDVRSHSLISEDSSSEPAR